MPSNEFQLPFTTDDYDLFSQFSQGSNARPGTVIVDEINHIYEPNTIFPPSTLDPPIPDNVSLMDKDNNINGPINDFWTDYPVSIDINGNILYHGENTGINVRGPISSPCYLRFEDLTEEQKDELKGRDGIDGTNGRNGVDGQNGAPGLSAYEEWEIDHPGQTEEDFYEYIAGYVTYFIKEGTGNGSLLLNYQGLSNTATGEGATASGQNTSASGTNSFTAGTGTSAAYPNQFVIGQYNENKSANLFEIGRGVENNNLNAFEVSTNGNVLAAGNITDGYGNVLSSKVDKVQGKQLSTNDFTNTYKDFLDNYEIDTELSNISMNPVENRVITEAINNILASTGDKIEVTDIDSSVNQTYSLITVKETSSSSGHNYLRKISNFPKITYNPNQYNFNINIGSSNNYTSGQNNFTCGYGLSSSNNNQWILGQFNLNNTNSQNYIFQIGNGSDTINRSNAVSVTREGEVIAQTEVSVGNHHLTQKQNALSFDVLPTQDSIAVITSGDLYNLGYNPAKQQFYPTDLTSALSYITNLQNRVNTLEYIVQQAAEILKCELIDDTTYKKYHYGVNNGVFYLQQVEEEEGD